MQTSFLNNRLYGMQESHANRGMDFEKAIARQHEEYLRKGIAVMDKEYVPSVLVRDGRWARVIGRSTVDYTGILCGGLGVAFDAKDCAGKRIELSRLQTHQLAHLENKARMGGCAFILARFERREVYAIPVAAWRLAIEAHRAGTNKEDQGLGWEATGKASINVQELPDRWRVNGVDWAKTISQTQGGWTA